MVAVAGGLRSFGFYGVVFVSGAVAMSLEMAASRLLAPVFGNTIFVWGSLIGVVLASLAVGYRLGGVLADRRPSVNMLAAIAFTGGLLTFAIPFFSPLVLEAAAAASLDEKIGPLIATTFLLAPPTIPMGMVSPYAVKLLAQTRGRVGVSAGDIYSLSTVGSIAGTFLTVFVLLPSLDVRTVVLGSGAVLMITAALYLSKTVKIFTALLLLIALTPVGYFAQGLTASGGEVLYSRETLYNSLAVVRQGDIVTLYLNGLPHSATSETDPAKLVFPYTRFFELGLALKPDAEKTLFIGGGGLSGPKYFLKNYPEVRVDVVEIDPDVVETARRFFHVPDDSRLRVFVDDARMFLTKTDEKYDVVIMDAYSKTYIPFHLMTLEFYQLLRQKMASDGVLVANLIASLTGDTSEIFWAQYRTVSQVFPKLYVFKASESGGSFVQNLILVACASTTCDLEQTPSRVKDGWLAEKIVSNKWTAIPALEEYPVLTDSYAPVERMINPITGKPYSIELEDAGVTLATLNYVGSNALSLAAAILAVFIWLFVLFQRII
ncbi:MAG: fused MFS/spermidine synthase [Candidatus Caldarchaeum sp.]|nr:fused MFS/spermidine synthase [Candidatus Caldarchaeales archaeon]MDJ0272303.1 fused MFS/spermidine synthase [Candidatus Caldarchaeales archaeon]